MAIIPTSGEQARLRAVILELLERRGHGKTMCPSDAARALAGTNFRQLMHAARGAAAELAAAGDIEVTQRRRHLAGKRTDPSAPRTQVAAVIRSSGASASGSAPRRAEAPS